MNYSDLFRATLPETVLEVVALLVLVVDLGVLRKAVLKTRVTAAVLVGVAGCCAALWAFLAQGTQGFSYLPSGNYCWRRAELRPWRRRESWC